MSDGNDKSKTDGWTELTLESVADDFVEFWEKAAPYEPFLRKHVKLISWEVMVSDPDGYKELRVVIQASPNAVEYWDACADGDMSVEDMASGHIYLTCMSVLEAEGLISTG